MSIQWWSTISQAATLTSLRLCAASTSSAALRGRQSPFANSLPDQVSSVLSPTDSSAQDLFSVGRARSSSLDLSALGPTSSSTQVLSSCSSMDSSRCLVIMLVYFFFQMAARRHAAQQTQRAEDKRGCSHSSILTIMLLWRGFRVHLLAKRCCGYCFVNIGFTNVDVASVSSI